MPDVKLDEFLAHHGVKGMHWGVRKQRNLDRFSRAASSNATRGDKVKALLGTHGLTDLELIRAKGSIAKASQRRVDGLLAQKQRVDEGKTTVRNKLDLYGNLTLRELVKGT